MPLPPFGFVKSYRTGSFSKLQKHMQELGEQMWKKFPSSPFLSGVWCPLLGGSFLEDAWLTQFLNNRGQELAVELVMTRVNEDGLWRIGRVGEEVSS